LVDEDVRLMLAFRDGDEHAFDALFERWAGRVLRFVERMVGEASVAEDLVQETFVRVWRAREPYQPEARFSTWLFTIAFQRWEALEEGERRAFQEGMLERMERAGGMPRRPDQLSPESCEKLAVLVRRWRDVDPGERRRMRERLERFRTLSPEDQRALIDKKFEAKSPEQRERILESLREASKALPRRPLLDAEPEPVEPAPEP
jgi:RNA polymerase sigma-70 factor (ECF subfamily)